MNDMLNKAIVLVLNRNWQAINIRTPQEAFCQMATNVATAQEIDGQNHIRPVTWDEWITDTAQVTIRSLEATVQGFEERHHRVGLRADHMGNWQGVGGLGNQEAEIVSSNAVALRFAQQRKVQRVGHLGRHKGNAGPIAIGQVARASEKPRLGRIRLDEDSGPLIESAHRVGVGQDAAGRHGQPKGGRQARERLDGAGKYKLEALGLIAGRL